VNFAFPALLAFLLILPGIILRFTYARGSWGWASPTSLRRFSDELAYGVVFSIPLHVIWMRLVGALGYPPDVQAPLALLAGNFGPNNYLLVPTLQAVSQNYLGVAGYFISLYAVAAGLGYVGHRAVRRIGLDHKTKTFRFDNYWYYMLTGEVLLFRESPSEEIEKPDGVYLSAIITHGTVSYVYRGIVSDFTFDPAGGLDTIVLTDAHRRTLADDLAADSTTPLGGQDPRYYEIRGDFLILRYADIRTLNLDYFWLAETREDAQG